MIDKWRPRLGLVVLTILIAVMLLPLVGLFFFRLYENQLVRQTEAELIAQGAVVAATYAREVREAALPPAQLGAAVATEPANDASERYRPIEPRLDLAMDAILPRRPDSVPAIINPAFAAIGARLSGILAEAQDTTLAGFRLLDPTGTVIAGGGDIGRSFAGVEEVRAALAGKYMSVLRTRVLDEPAPPLYSISRGTKVRIFVAMPVIIGNQVAGVVYLSRTPNNIVKHLYSERGKVALAVISILGATLLIGLVFLRTISRPIYELMDRTARIAAGDRDAVRPLSRHGTREMAELSGAFLDMAQKLQARSDTIRTFATHVSHELKSPLTAIQGAAELLRDGGEAMDQAQRQRFHDNIIADTGRLNQLVRRLIELARAESTSLTGETTSLAEVLKSVVPDSHLSIQLDGGSDIRFRMSAEHAAIILSNLADNSAQHGATRLSVSALNAGETAVISTWDNGSGISPGNRRRIFEPFFTTRRETGGTGLGLGIVAALIKAHEGSVQLMESETGTRFEIRLPLA
jgi:signal transduction histidine kinase